MPKAPTKLELARQIKQMHFNKLDVLAQETAAEWRAVRKSMDRIARLEATECKCRMDEYCEGCQE